MSIFVTGSTGYIGSYVVTNLLREHKQRLALLVRAKTVREAHERLWKSLQLHMTFGEFQDLLPRVDVYLGDLTDPMLGLSKDEYGRLARSMESVIHVAASLNRKSAKACLNVNLRGTLEVIKLARAAQDHHGLLRFSDVSTVAVAGHRRSETVTEDGSIEWDRSDYDPYARTKKFCEHMLHELLPDVPHTVFRPSTVLGDSRFPETTQFDMVRAFVMLTRMPVVPLPPKARMDIVPANYVGRAIVHIHQKDKPAHNIYHLSSGAASLSYQAILDSLRAHGHSIPNVFVPALEKSFSTMVDALADSPRGWGVALPASLFKVFLPYLSYDTVFDNQRVVSELGEAPAPFSDYAYGLMRFALDGKFTYPYKAWPKAANTAEVASSPAY